jgi:predicted ATPase with chaperone activity
VGLRGGPVGNHVLFRGPPRVGKTMLAERVPGLLPDLALHDSLEVSAVHSLAGFNLADETRYQTAVYLVLAKAECDHERRSTPRARGCRQRRFRSQDRP